MTDQAMVELVLNDTHSSDGRPTISVLLARGPSCERDLKLGDLGLDKSDIEALILMSRGEGGARKVGERLLAALQRKDTVRTALKNALALAQCPISVLFEGVNGVALPWEALFDSAWPGFLELSGTTPISRAVQPHQSATAPALLDRPRMLAVLSAPRPGAAHDPVPTGDWSYTELQQIIRAISESKVEVNLRVLSSETAVLNEAASRGLTAKRILDEDTLTGEIKNFQPHFLHFFCHGTDTPSPQLLLHRPADVFTGTPQLGIDADLLTRDVGYTCLVVLNSCSGASADDGTQSMAHQLVSKRFPATIGMRGPVDWHDAVNFTFALYKQVLPMVRSPVAGRLDLRVMGALERPRRAILHRFGGSAPDQAEIHHEWTLPVIYTRPGTVEIPVMPVTGERSLQQAWREGQHLAVNSLRTHLHRDTPPEVRDRIAGLADELAATHAATPPAGTWTFEFAVQESWTPKDPPTPESPVWGPWREERRTNGPYTEGPYTEGTAG